MTFAPGDKVKYKDDPWSEWHGWEGTVQSEFGGVTTAFTTKGTVKSYGTEVRLTTANLELVAEPAFTFADIQVGDEIRRSVTRPSGTTEVREGVVRSKSGVYATDSTNKGYILAYNSDGDPAKPQVVLTLLNRPEPPKEPELWEDRKPGEQIAAYCKDGGELDRIFTKREDGDWDTLVMNTSGRIQKGFSRSDKELGEFLVRQIKKEQLTVRSVS